MPLRHADQDPAGGPSSAVSRSSTSGRRIREASQPSPVSLEIRRRSPDTSSVHGAEADQAARLRSAASWTRVGRDAPGEEVVAVDDHVEATRVEDVDHDSPPGPSSTSGSEWLRLELRGQGRLVDLGDDEALHAGRAEAGKRIADAVDQLCSGESAIEGARRGRGPGGDRQTGDGPRRSGSGSRARCRA